jgi:hypothetical protein
MVVHRLITRDPATGGELLVTRLESPDSGVVIEGRFSMGWVSRLTPEQLDFVGLLLRNRNNLQKLATDLGVAYNTARSRLDEVVAAVGGVPDEDSGEGDPEDVQERSARRTRALDRLAAGEVSVEDALAELRSQD